MRAGQPPAVARRRQWLGWIAALAVVLLGGAVVVLLPDTLVTRDAAGLSLTGAERVNAVNQVRTTLLQGLGGVVLVAGVVATWLQLQVAREGQVTERFTRAVDQLGSPEVDVRIGGIYGLERIARDSAADRVAVIEVLAAFVRQHAPWPPKASSGDPTVGAGSTTVAQLRTRAPDVQAAMTVLGRAHWRNPSIELQLSDTDLRAAYLPDADLQGAYLHDVHLENAQLGRAVLRHANLGNAHLEDAVLCDADLEDADLHDARLERADLRRARLDGADFRIDEGERGARLSGTDLRGARLGRAKVVGADLRGARADATTIWPPGFDSVANGVLLEESVAGQQPARELDAQQAREPFT
jgi:hypothetical protein